MAENRRILIIQGHPDVTEDHLGHALAHAYAGAATTAGPRVRPATPARLELGAATRSGLWSPAPLRPT